MKTDEIASIVLLIFAIIAGICTQWWVGLIIFVTGAVLIGKYIGFSKDETPSDRSSGSNNSGTSSKTKVAWDFYLSKESVLEYLERYYNYDENQFYRSNDWPNIYRLDDYYKETILAPFRELLSYAPEELEFIRYENDDFYIGQTDGNGNPHGTGLYHWASEKDSQGDIHSEMFAGRWNHGEQTNDGSQIHHASDDTKTWFEACSEGFRLAPIYGLRKLK